MATAKKPTAKVAMSATAPATKPDSATPLVLVVTPKVAGFRRAGRAFPDGETRIPLEGLTDEQYEQLTQEPMLVTYLSEAIDPPAADEGGTST